METSAPILDDSSQSATDHSLYSSYREALLEHLFSGEIMRCVWRSGVKRLEILKPQVDDGGYDLVLEASAVVRHIQLKATFKGSTVNRFKINTALQSKPGGCIVVLQFNQETLDLGPFFWFGGKPGEPLPDLHAYPIAKHTKGNAKGVKLSRPNIRVVPLSDFCKVDSVGEIAQRMFGSLLGPSVQTK